MKNLILAAIFFTSAPALAKVECKALSLPNSGSQREEKAMPLTYESPDFLKWEAEIGELSYSVFFDKENEDYLLMITRGPEYLDGAAMRGVFSKNKLLKGSLVSATITGQIVCSDL